MNPVRFLLAVMAFALLLMTAAHAQTDWRVMPNGVLPTRPAYALTASGALSPIASGRAAVGAACNCTSPMVVGRTTYCAAPTLLAVCGRLVPYPMPPIIGPLDPTPAPAPPPPVQLVFSLPPPDGLFRVPAGWSAVSFTSSSDSPTVPPICARAAGRPHVATMTGTHPLGPFEYTLCETDGGGVVGWWRINPRSALPLGDQ